MAKRVNLGLMLKRLFTGRPRGKAPRREVPAPRRFGRLNRFLRKIFR